MSTSNSGKLSIITPSGSPIPQLVKLIERLVREGRLDDVQNILINIEKKMRLGIGSVVKTDPEDIYLQEKLHKSEKEREDLKVLNTKLVEQIKGLIDRTKETDKIICELKSKVSEKDQTLEMYQEKIKLFDLKLIKLNMELFSLWESRSEAEKIIQQMRGKLHEALKNQENLRRQLMNSGQMMTEVSRESFETKLAMERMKRKAPETDKSVEELKRQNMEARRTVEKLCRQNIEANLAIKKLWKEKSEADQVHKRWLGNSALIIKNVGEGLGMSANEKVSAKAEIGKSKKHLGASSSGGDGH